MEPYAWWCVWYWKCWWLIGYGKGWYGWSQSKIIDGWLNQGHYLSFQKGSVEWFSFDTEGCKLLIGCLELQIEGGLVMLRWPRVALSAVFLAMRLLWWLWRRWCSHHWLRFQCFWHHANHRFQLCIKGFFAPWLFYIFSVLFDFIVMDSCLVDGMFDHREEFWKRVFLMCQHDD